MRGDEHKQMARHAFSLDVPGSAHRAICVLFVELISALPRRVVSGYTFELAHATMSYLAWIRSRYIVARHLLRRGTVVNPEWLLLDVKADCDRAGYPITPDFGRAADLVLGPATSLHVASYSFACGKKKGTPSSLPLPDGTASAKLLHVQ